MSSNQSPLSLFATVTCCLAAAGAMYYVWPASRTSVVATSGAAMASAQPTLQESEVSGANDSDWQVVLEETLARLNGAIDNAFHSGAMFAIEDAKAVTIRDFQDVTTLVVFVSNGQGAWGLLLDRADYSALDRLPIGDNLKGEKLLEVIDHDESALEVTLSSCDPCTMISVLQIGLSEPVMLYMYSLQECADKPVTCRHDNSILSHWQNGLHIPQRNGWSLFGIGPNGATIETVQSQEYSLCGSGGTPCVVVRYVRHE